MAYTTRAYPKYVPLFHDALSPDMIFLVHKCIQLHCNLHTSRHKYAIALCVDLPRVPAFLIVNQYGLFVIAQTTSFHEWLSTLPLPTVIGGFFNDAIWHSPPLRRRARGTSQSIASAFETTFHPAR